MGDLTTEACLAALRRFIARRGRPQEISDCATNFVGTYIELVHMQKLVQSKIFNHAIASLAAA